MKKEEKTMQDTAAYHLHSPSELSQGVVLAAQELAITGGLSWYCALDKVLNPLRTRLVYLIARPGHGKTAWMIHHAKKLAEDIYSGRVGNDESVILYASAEQTTEELSLLLLGNQIVNSTELMRGNAPTEYVESMAINMPRYPIWMIGNANRHAGILDRPEFAFEAIERAIQIVQEVYGKRPIILYTDYLQRLTSEEQGWKDNHQAIVRWMSSRLKNISMMYNIPVVAGAQAQRDVDGYEDGLPKLTSIQWSSAAEQDADIVIGMSFPQRHHGDAEQLVEVNGVMYDNVRELFTMRLLKQRYGIGVGTVVGHFFPHENRMEEINSMDLQTGSAWEVDAFRGEF